MANKVALAIGHSRTINGHLDGGAETWDGHSNEWRFNCDLAGRIQGKLAVLGVEAPIFNHYQGDGYGQAMQWMADQIDVAGCIAGIEMHFNSAEALAHGHEVLFCSGSVRGEAFAKFLEASLSAHFNTPARGAHPLTSEDRGYAAVQKPRAVMIISEPFFGSSQEDWEAMAARIDELADAFVEAIMNYLKWMH